MTGANGRQSRKRDQKDPTPAESVGPARPKGAEPKAAAASASEVAAATKEAAPPPVPETPPGGSSLGSPTKESVKKQQKTYGSPGEKKQAGSVHSAPGGWPKEKGKGKGKMKGPNLAFPQSTAPLTWEMDVYGNWWYFDGRDWWMGSRTLQNPLQPAPVMQSSGSWTGVSGATWVHPSMSGWSNGVAAAADGKKKKPPKEAKSGKKDAKKEVKKEPAKGQKEPKKAKGGAPPGDDGDDGDDGGDDDGDEDSYTWEYEEEESEEEEGAADVSLPVTPRSEASVPEPKRKAAPKRGAKKSAARPPSGPPSGPPSAAPSSSATIRTESIRELLRDRPQGKADRPKPAIGQIKIEAFKGDRSHYKDWIKVVQAQRRLYQLADAELAVLIYLSTEGEARQVVNQLEIDDMQAEGGLGRMLRLLDDAFGSKSDERFEERHAEYGSFRRQPGQSIAAYIATLKRLRAELLKEDPGSTISDRAFAQKMLQKAGLTRKERYDVFFAAGGHYKSAEIERVLRFRCAHVHKEEQVGRATRREEHRASASSGSKRPPPRKSFPYRRGDRRRPYKPTRYTHLADHEEEDEPDEEEDDYDEEEDLEMEAMIADGEMPEEEWSENDEYDEDEDDFETMDQHALSEAFAAGWRAKNKTAEARKSRGYKQKGKGKGKGKPSEQRNPEDRKKNSTCASCLQKGHWKGDSVCPNVKSGQDPPHRKEQQGSYIVRGGSADRSGKSAGKSKSPGKNKSPGKGNKGKRSNKMGTPAAERGRPAERDRGRASSGSQKPPEPDHPPPGRRDVRDMPPAPKEPPPAPPRRKVIAQREEPDTSPETVIKRRQKRWGAFDEDDEDTHRTTVPKSAPPRSQEEREAAERAGKKVKQEKDKKDKKERHRRHEEGDGSRSRGRRPRTREEHEADLILPVTTTEGTAAAATTPATPVEGEAATRNVNWTLVHGWDFLQEYDSDSSTGKSWESIKDSEEEEDLATRFKMKEEEDKKEARRKLKVKLMTVLRSLADEEEDEETKQRLRRKEQRLRERKSSAAASSSETGGRAKSRVKRSHDADMAEVEVGLSVQDLLKILPNMDKEEKKLLYKQLKKEREDEAVKMFGKSTRYIQSEPAKMKRPDQRKDGYSSSSSHRKKDSVSEPPDENEDVPSGVKKKRLETFRRELYENAKDKRGRVRPSEASEVPTPLQETCSHPYERLLWGANKHAHWATCRECKLKKVLYYSILHGAMVEGIHEMGNETLQAQHPPVGHVIMDTRCRTAVAGKNWHDEMKMRVKHLGLEYHTAHHEEVFRFGAGSPVLSTKAYIYPVTIYKEKSWVRIAEVDNTKDDHRVAECPGLIGPSELSRWKVQIDFAAHKVGIGGHWEPTVMSPSRHPILNLLNVQAGQCRKSEWHTRELEALRQRLIGDPYSFALVQEALESCASSVEEPGQETEQMIYHSGQETLKLAAWQEGMEDEVLQVMDKMGGPEVFKVISGPQAAESDNDSLGSISERESETSHDDGLSAQSSTSSETESEEDYNEALTGDVGGDTEIFTKAQKRRVLAASKQIAEAATSEMERQQPHKIKIHKSLGLKWKILELFTWSCLLSQYAFSMGWEYLEPITLPGWDIMDAGCRREAMKYLERSQPDFIMIAWPCGPWSALQNINQRTPTQRAALRYKRMQSRVLLRFARDVALWQRHRGKAVLGENPLRSGAWKEDPIIEGFGGLSEALADQCCFGLKHPNNGMALKKPTRFVGQEEVVAPLRKRCDGCHEHYAIEGTVATKEFGTISLSSWAGGYPKPLCAAIMKGVTSFLEKQAAAPPKAVYTLDDRIAEGAFQDGLDALEEELDMEVEASGRPPVSRDPDVEPEQEEPAEDERFPISKEIQKAVEFAHRQLGHPSRETLVRMLKISGANADAVKHARKWQCPVCQARQPPKHPMASTPSLRPYGFNKRVHIDIKFVYDSEDRKYACLSMIDLGTCYHATCMLKTRRSDYVAGKFLRHWVQPFGAPEHVTHDQGGEFELSFHEMLESMAAPSTVTAAHAGWQLAVGERHGSILGSMISAIAAEHQTEGFTAMKAALAAAASAKNMTVTRDCYTPNQRLFGTDLKFPSLTEEDAKPSFAEALDADTEYARAHKMRITARLALIRMDVKKKMIRAVLRKPGGAGEGPILPGTQIYFWVPKKLRKRYARGGLWRGPATVLVREGQRRYFVSWRGRALLIAQENMRLATKEELALNEPAKQDAEEIGHLLRDPLRENAYRDQTHMAPPPLRPARKRRATTEENPARKRARMMLRGSKSIQKMLKDYQIRAQQLPRKRPKMLEAPADERPIKRPALPPPAEEEPESDGYSPSVLEEAEPHQPETGEPAAPEESDVAAPPGPPRAEDVPVPEMNDDEWLGEMMRDMPAEERRRQAIDDVPHSIKRRSEGIAEEDAEREVKRLRGSFCAGVAATTVFGLHGTMQNEWISKYELETLRQLTGLPLTAARIHRGRRKRLQKPPKLVSRARLSILLGDDPKDAFIVNETEAQVKSYPRRRAAFQWRGMTLFYRNKNKHKTEKVYIQLPEGVHEVKMTPEESSKFTALWTEEVHDCLLSEVLLLKLKQNGRELDPKFFSTEERAEFVKSDAKEWSEWIKNGVIKRVSPAEAAKVPRSMIFKAPLRMVRTNKAASPAIPMIAKSRLVVPGHLDPHLGEFRTDSPTCPATAVRAAKTVAAARGWEAVTFDVTTAFLSGKPTSRKIYIRPPSEGLPAAMDWKPVKAEELLQILKSAYGLTESPRLWYLEAVDRLSKTDLKELDIAKSTFVAGGSATEPSWAILCLHVDDGLLLGDSKDKRFQKLKAQIDSMFKIKEWKTLGEKPLQFLGIWTTRTPKGELKDDMTEYIKQIKVQDLKGSGPMDPKGITLFRQLIMRLRWPAQQTMPHLLYQVSSLAQRVTKATFEDYREAVALTKKFVEEAEAGRASLTYPVQNDKELFYLSFFDASLGKEEDGKSQLGAMHFVTSTKAEFGPKPASVVEFTTNKSSRVCRSSMAAEAMSMSLCVDRHLYGRLVLDMMLYGHRPLTDDWRVTMKVPGGLVTDAKSLYDHLQSTGQMPAERQTMLDLMVARDHLESGAYRLFWVPTFCQFGDGLTKKMKNLLWERFCKQPWVSLKETEAEERLGKHRQRLRQDQRQRRKERRKAA